MAKLDFCGLGKRSKYRRLLGIVLNRDSGMRWASRLVVQLDVGELGVLQWPCVRSREAVSAFIFLGTMGAMVGLWSSLVWP